MDDLVAWLRSCLDEDERVAREASGDAWVTGLAAGYEYSRPGDVYAIAQNGTPARIAQGTRCGPDISAEQSSAHIARHDPARVLAEVEAKRRILDEHSPIERKVNWTDDDGEERQTHREVCVTCVPKYSHVTEAELGPCPTLRLLALPYADQPGYDEAWRPVE